MSLPDQKYLGHIYCQFRFEYLHHLLLNSINIYSILIQCLLSAGYTKHGLHFYQLMLSVYGFPTLKTPENL